MFLNLLIPKCTELNNVGSLIKMDIDRQINRANKALEDYEMLSPETKASGKRAIDTKFALGAKHSKLNELIRKLISILLPRNVHLAQTNPNAVANRLLKIAKQKNVTAEQKQKLHDLHERYKKIFEDTAANKSSFEKLDQKWVVLNKPKQPSPILLTEFFVDERWYDSGESIGITVGGIKYLISKADLPSEDAKSIAVQLAQKIKNKNPQNSFEYILKIASNPALPKEIQDSLHVIFQLDSKYILNAYTGRENLNTGHYVSTTNILFSHYFNRHDCTFIDLNGSSMNGSPSDKIAYTCQFIVMEDPNLVAETVRNFLGKELARNMHNRPQKIFIPLVFRKHSHYHSVLLVVEPSSSKINEARITMVNTHGDSLKLYLDLEEGALKGAKEVYSSTNSIVLRNKKCIYTTARSCGPDTIEIARSLMDVENVQATVKNGLPRKTKEDDKNARLEHGEATDHFLKAYSLDKT